MKCIEICLVCQNQPVLEAVVEWLPLQCCAFHYFNKLSYDLLWDFWFEYVCVKYKNGVILFLLYTNYVKDGNCHFCHNMQFIIVFDEYWKFVLLLRLITVHLVNIEMAPFLKLIHLIALCNETVFCLLQLKKKDCKKTLTFNTKDIYEAESDGRSSEMDYTLKTVKCNAFEVVINVLYSHI